ncbi:hypothetical protein PISL3812_02836 [Talaromyces islandicus]|uniref:Uncharacterized protein n=1 Tax=Talaromyces islandicus TaxID=28573 RepID=A0A0U1LQZ8_TALIS|nr:hypothetical protein PISL3812_02836 [Talaromyces islandicus]
MAFVNDSQIPLEQQHEASQPLLRDDSDDKMAFTPYHDDSESETTISSTTIYTPSTSEPTLPGDGLPAYHDVTPPYTTPSVGDYKGDVAVDHKGQDDDEEANEPTTTRRRGCCGRVRRAKKCDKKGRFRRRLCVFLKIFLGVALLSFFFGKNCVRSRKGKDFMWADCPQVEYNTQNREIVRETGSRAIWGRYPLYDLLSLKTTSGSIVVTVEPQPADPENPDEPARLVLETVSGSVAVSFAHPHLDAIFERDDMMIDFDDQPFVPDQGDIKAFKRSCKKHKKQQQGHKLDKTTTADAIQYRPYEIVIKTNSGSVSGKLIFSSSAHVESQTGTISASLIPIVSSRASSFGNTTLFTSTHSGSQNVVLANPFRVASSAADGSGEGVSLGHATSTHVSDVGHIDVVYPNSWAGTVEASTHAGSICMDGPGLEVSKDGQGHASGVKYADEDSEGPEWWGSRGDMDVSLKAKASGSINFVVKRPRHAD